MKISFLNLLFFAALTMFWTACDDDDVVEPPNEAELITTVTMQLAGVAGSETLSFRDVDGPGGDAPVVTGGTLMANTEYAFGISFLNESVNPIVNITEEVREEGTDHFVLYTSGALNFNFVLSDVDADGNPIGLTGTLTTGDVGVGDLQVVLRHEPTKTSTGATGGETDVDVSFPVTVE